ncbi:MAG: DUF975 family protein [Clostridia bacterium]
MRTRAEIKQYAKQNFSKAWGSNVGAYILFMLLTITISSVTFGIGAIILAPPLMVGYAFFCSKTYAGGSPQVGDMFSNAFTNFGRKLGGMLWMQLFVFLWTLLFIIPGIIKSIAYSMTPYILANENVSACDALKISMRMTSGYKGQIFLMWLSFIGWQFLNALTLGILMILYSGPYMEITFAGMYYDLRQTALDKGKVTLNQLNGTERA